MKEVRKIWTYSFLNNIHYLTLSMFRSIGKIFLDLSQVAGSFCIFCLKAILSLFTKSFYFRIFLRQLVFIGFYSLPVVGLTAIFSGAVLALQSYTGFSRFSAENSIPMVVVLSITRELGPVLAGLMVSGRVGASIAAEIGTMRVTEQIDALYTLATDPMKYLVTPRIIAGIISLPCLVLVADIIGVMGGYLIGVYKLGFNPTIYIINTLKYLEAIDVISGLIKSAVFGFIITAVSTYSGFYCEKGAKGVGKSTTSAVVASAVLILLSNYILTELFF